MAAGTRVDAKGLLVTNNRGDGRVHGRRWRRAAAAAPVNTDRRR